MPTDKTHQLNAVTILLGSLLLSAPLVSNAASSNAGRQRHHEALDLIDCLTKAEHQPLDCNKREPSQLTVQATLPKIIELLQDEKFDARQSAAWALGVIGSDSPAVIDALLNLEKSDRTYLRTAAIEALAKIGKTSGKAPDFFIRRLVDHDASVRSSAADSLGILRPVTTEALEALRVALQRESSERIRYQILQAIIATRSTDSIARDAVRNALKDKDSNVRLSAGFYLSRNDPEYALPLFIQMLDSPDIGHRRESARWLSDMGPKAKLAVPSLINHLKDPDWMVRSSAANALNFIGTETDNAAAFLLGTLTDENPNVRRDAAIALGRTGDDSKEVISGLTTALHDPDPTVRSFAALSLGRIGAAASSAIPDLFEILHDTDSRSHYGATKALAQFSAHSTGTFNALLELSRDSDSILRTKAVEAIGYIRPVTDKSMDVLVSALNDSHPEAELAALKAFVDIGSAAAKAAPYLKTELANKNPRFRSLAARALILMVPPSDPAMSAIIDLARKNCRAPSPEGLGNCIVVLWGFEKAQSLSPEWIPLLSALLRHWHLQVRGTAVFGLGKIAERNADAVPYIASALADTDVKVRDHAIDTLVKYGPLAIPALKRTSTTGILRARLAAKVALQRIELRERTRQDINDFPPPN